MVGVASVILDASICALPLLFHCLVGCSGKNSRCLFVSLQNSLCRMSAVSHLHGS